MTRILNRPHGAVRSLSYVSRSTTESSRFGRMFRWLPGKTFDRADLGRLALNMIQQQVATAEFLSEKVTEGPFAYFNASPPGLDQPVIEAEPGDENPAILTACQFRQQLRTSRQQRGDLGDCEGRILLTALIILCERGGIRASLVTRASATSGDTHHGYSYGADLGPDRRSSGSLGSRCGDCRRR